MCTLGEFRRHVVGSLAAAAGAIALLAAASQTSAQSVRTLRIVVPVPPGGAGDIVAREMAEQISRLPGISVVTENRPGAGTIIGTDLVARAPPDGNTLLLNAPYFLISSQLRKVNYDP